MHAEVSGQFFHFIGILGTLVHGLDQLLHFFGFLGLVLLDLVVGIDHSIRQSMSSEAVRDRYPWVGPNGVLITLSPKTFGSMKLTVLAFLAAHTGDLNPILVFHATRNATMLLSQPDQLLQIGRTHKLGVIAIGGAAIGQGFVLFRQASTVEKIFALGLFDFVFSVPFQGALNREDVLDNDTSSGPSARARSRSLDLNLYFRGRRINFHKRT
jgi:hypothetical protein